MSDRNYDFQLPDLGEGVVEGELVKWLVKEGEIAQADQPLVQVMTDKATVEIPSPRMATIKKLHFQEGQIIPVGAPMVTMELAEGETRPATMPHHGSSPAPATSGAPTDPTPQRVGLATPDPNGGAVGRARAALVAMPGQKPLATPATRKLAREMGVDLAQVQGSGPAGRITRDDIQTPAAAPIAAPIRPAAKAIQAREAEERQPIRGLRRKIAEKMTHSAFTAPHVTHVDEADVTSLIALRNKLKPLAESRGVKLSYLPFIIKAAIAALREFPYFNASIDDATQEIILKRHYDIGFAAATDNGLLVPVIKDAEHLTLLALADETSRLADATRQGKATLEELTGGTFTITNVGSLGGLFATPIINHPEVAILGVNKIQQRPVVREGQIVARDMIYLALSFDHRIVDGADAVKFTNHLIKSLETPESLFLDL